MKIIQIEPTGIFMVNSYLVVSDNNNAVLIDAPCDAGHILDTAQKNGVTIKKILITHGHCDHIESLAEIAEKTNAEVYVHAYDAAKLSDAHANLSDYFKPYLRNRGVVEYTNAIAVNDGDTITMDELSFKVLHTPGHSAGCVCYIIDDVMFSGDTLFNMSIGRTDIGDGDSAVLYKSLEMLAGYKGDYADYKVFAGHGNETTLSYEREHNPYL